MNMTSDYTIGMVESLQAQQQNNTMHTHIDIDGIRMISESRRRAKAFEKRRAQDRRRAALVRFCREWVAPFAIAVIALPFIWFFLVVFLLAFPPAI